MELDADIIEFLNFAGFSFVLQIGSVFEYANQRPAFGVVNSDNVFYAPLLGFFAFTGIPTSVSQFSFPTKYYCSCR